jgi:hypothetical protein
MQLSELGSPHDLSSHSIEEIKLYFMHLLGLFNWFIIESRERAEVWFLVSLVLFFVDTSHVN